MFSQKDVVKNRTEVQAKELSVCKRHYLRNSVLAELPSSALQIHLSCDLKLLNLGVPIPVLKGIFKTRKELCCRRELQAEV